MRGLPWFLYNYIHGQNCIRLWFSPDAAAVTMPDARFRTQLETLCQSNLCAYSMLQLLYKR